MLGENVRQRTFFPASLLICDERLTPYQVYSFEPGFDGESKSRIKNGGGSVFDQNTPFGHPSQQ